MGEDKADRVLAAGSGHSLVSGVLSLAGGSDAPDEAKDLMPEMSEEQSHKILTRPHGVIAVHIKQVKFRNRHFATFFDPGSSVGVYLHLHVFGKTRATAVYKNVQFPSTIAYDDIKHFSVTPNPKHYDEENQIRIELIGYDRPDVHQIIAWRYVHIFDIIKKMYVADTYKMVSKDNKTVAEVEIEYCFAYGQMGYGASNQLENNQTRPADLICHSMFPRPAPPGGRQIDEDTDVMNCIPVGPPEFLDFPERSQISYKKEYAPISTNANFVIEPMMLKKRIRRRMLDHQEELQNLRTRKERMRFIRDIANPASLNHPFDTDEFMVPNSLRMKVFDGSKLNAFNQVARPPTAVSDFDDGMPNTLSELDAVLEQAPGLKSLRRPRGRAAIIPDVSDSSLGSGADSSRSLDDRVPSFGEWLCNLICRPFRRRKKRVIVPQIILPQESEMSYMSDDDRRSVHTYYSADINVMTQDRTDPAYDEVPSDEDPSQELVRQRILEANTLLEAGEVEEYHGNRGFGHSKGDEEAALRLRKPIPNIA